MDDKTKDLIQNYINDNEVCLFMKGTPEVNFKGINVLEDQSLREGIKIYSEWPTIPQLYIKKEFIGGCDIVKEMYESGELKKVLENKNINYKK